MASLSLPATPPSKLFQKSFRRRNVIFVDIVINIRHLQGSKSLPFLIIWLKDLNAKTFSSTIMIFQCINAYICMKRNKYCLLSIVLRRCGSLLTLSFHPLYIEPSALKTMTHFYRNWLRNKITCIFVISDTYPCIIYCFDPSIIGDCFSPEAARCGINCNP